MNACWGFPHDSGSATSKPSIVTSYTCSPTRPPWNEFFLNAVALLSAGYTYSGKRSMDELLDGVITYAGTLTNLTSHPVGLLL